MDIEAIRQWYSENISDISYTNKDFNTIYPELLDLVKKVTNKWDPSLSNESDPGVLLLKLNAIIADKNNYNIDKNVLECFPGSVTQEGNARKLYDSLGYRMHWFKSATVDVTFELMQNEHNVTSYTIPIWDSITDSTGEIVYTLTQPTSLINVDSPTTVKCIEGTVHDYEVNGDKVITLNNLDNDLRLYFSESRIAENGIYIKYAGDSISWDTDTSSPTYDGWKLVDNLASYPARSMVYEFGILPNSNICYIQFPQDISTLIQSGLNIKYTISNGLNGNVKANTLTSFYSDQIIEGADVSLNEYIRISQTEPTTNGVDPESIDTAYNNFKKVVATFNTLVTKKDYENYLYRYTNNNENLCSNLIVADRTNDINYSHYIQTWDSGNTYKKLQVTPKFTTVTGTIKDNVHGDQATIIVQDDTLNAYNIVLYMLQPQASVYDKATFNKTFMPLLGVQEYEIEDAIGEVKSSQHNILFAGTDDLANQTIFNFENLLTLKGQLITYHKVTKAEAGEIETKVMEALYKTYNARNVNFGEELDYNSLVDTIINADSRIKNIIISDAHYTANKQTVKGVSTTLTAEDYNALVAKMALAGSVQLFKFDENFYYEFGQTEVDPVKHGTDPVIRAVTSEVKLDIPTVEAEPLKIKENEVLQVFAPSLVVDQEFTTYVKYYFYSMPVNTTSNDDEVQAGTSSVPSKVVIPANTNYQLKTGEFLKLYYVNSDSVGTTVILKYPDIICANIPLTMNSISGWNDDSDLPVNASDTSKAWYENSDYYKSINSGKYIQVKTINSNKLTYKTKYYFKLNNPTNSLAINYFDENGNWHKQDYILQENEYFIYSNSSSSEMIILGSGTQLSLPEGYVFNHTIPNANLDDLSNGKATWLTLGESEDIKTSNGTVIPAVELIITDLDIYSFGKDTYVRSAEGQQGIGNTAVDLKLPFEYSSDKEDWVALTDYNIDGVTWKAQSRLNITASLEVGQALQPNHTFTFYYKGATDDKLSDPEVVDGSVDGGGWYVRFNHPVILSGGVSLDTKVLNYYNELEYSLVAYKYRIDPNFTSTKVSAGVISVSGPTEGEISEGQTSKTYNLPFNFRTTGDWEEIADKYAIPAYIVPVYINLLDDKASITLNYNSGTISLYNPVVSKLKPLGTNNNGVYTIKGPLSGFFTLYFKNTKTNVADCLTSIVFKAGCTSSSYMNIGRISLITGLNTDEIDCTEINGNYSLLDNIENVLQYIEDIDVNNLFNWSNRVTDATKVLSPTKADTFWDDNHIYNKYTIPKIDFETYKISVNSSNVV